MASFGVLRLEGVLQFGLNMEEVSAAENIFIFSDSVMGVFKIFPHEADDSKLRDWIEVYYS